MGAMFNQILAVFQGFLSRAFWFGNFLPVVIAAALHVAVAKVQFGETVPLEKWVESPTILSVAFLSLVVLAYALTPLIPLFRGILDGRLLWTWLNNQLRRERVIEARRMANEIDSVAGLAGVFDWFNREQRNWFDDASRKGDAIGAVTDVASITAAEQAVAQLRRWVEAAVLPSADLGHDAFTKLIDALEANSSALPENHPDADRVNRLIRARTELVKLYGQVAAEAQYQWLALSLRYQTRYAIDNSQATRIGDARLLTERYSLNAYRVDFDYIWPRLQLVLPDQSSFRDQLIASNAQLDFAILSLVLILTLPLVWLPWLAWTAGSPWLFLVVGTATPFLVSFFYRLAVEAQFGFGETLKVAIDRYRFDLLKILRQPVPPNLFTERALWQQLDEATRHGAAIDLSYRHPPSLAQKSQ